jgi:uncharacterized membrane protein
MWYRIVQGCLGVAATIVWFVFLIGSQATITLDGEVIVGTIGTSAILLGNGYGLFVMAASGFAARKRIKDFEAMFKMANIRWRHPDHGADKTNDV